MLKELYHGEISPSERKAEPDDRLTQKWLKLSAEFEKTLTAEQIDMFHKLSDMQELMLNRFLSHHTDSESCFCSVQQTYFHKAEPVSKNS